VALYGPALLAISITCIGFILLLTPTGKLPSPRWRWWARVATAAPVVVLLTVTLLPQPLGPEYQSVANPLGLGALEAVLQAATGVALAVTVLGVLVAAASLVGRFRHARGTERQQLRWVALAAAAVSLAAALVLAAMVTETPALFGWGLGLCATILPLAVGAAVLRYRLYDLDRIISRTLTYGLLTVLLGGGYVGIVLGWASSSGEGRAWSWPGRPWPWPRRSSRPAAASSTRSTGASTAASTARPGPSRPTAFDCATSSTWTPSRPNCSRSWTRPWSQPGSRSGFDPPHPAPRAPPAVRHGQLPGPTDPHPRLRPPPIRLRKCQSTSATDH
jgi:hypothetical protein